MEGWLTANLRGGWSVWQLGADGHHGGAPPSLMRWHRYALRGLRRSWHIRCHSEGYPQISPGGQGLAGGLGRCGTAGADGAVESGVSARGCGGRSALESGAGGGGGLSPGPSGRTGPGATISRRGYSPRRLWQSAGDGVGGYGALFADAGFLGGGDRLIYCRGEKSTALRSLEMTSLTMGPLASVRSRVATHSGSVRKASQACSCAAALA